VSKKNGASLFRPRWSKVLADLWDNKTRTLLVVASIAVGVFAVGTIANAYLILSEDIDASYAAVNPANIEIITDPFDDNFVNSIKEIRGVEDVEGRYNMSVSVIQPGKPQQMLSLIANDDFKNSHINQIEPKEGKSIPGEKELLIGHEPMRDPGYRLGDVLPVQLEDGTIRRIPVVGIVSDQTAAGEFNAPTAGYISTDSLT